ncbi:DUF3558 domain-containing protein [Amycolatopsis sp. NBC_01480]|uniref:DUF3558 domain-containing protein n=1 Tax=Amycolatopsis sp. NBC_01480 TaxID=2903562 RepID=UPI002E2B7D6C|nr:DUF3558 domain-containing protein [Amycolatopsis sp. NBC_01480]
MLLSACSSDPGHATPSAAPWSSGPGVTPSDPAPPKIASPLPAGALNGDPCQALTPGQVTTLLGVPATGEAQDTGLAHMCHWANLDRGSSISVQFVYAWPDGLRAVYAKKNEGFFKELDPVQGYPVTAYGPEDDRPTGRCSVAVGVADNAAFEADATISRSKVGQADACDSARRISDAVITTLKGGA